MKAPEQPLVELNDKLIERMTSIDGPNRDRFPTPCHLTLTWLGLTAVAAALAAAAAHGSPLTVHTT